MESREDRRLKLQDLLDGQKSQKQRNVMGQFATPSKLAAEVLAYAKTLLPAHTGVRFLDPAIGTGSFYSALIDQFPAEQVVNARGFEIDPHYGEPAVNFWASSLLEIKLADFTSIDVPDVSEKPNLIICNPPYVRHHHLPAATKLRLAERSLRSSGLRVGGLAGLYCHFVTIAHAWMADGAVAGWLIPSEFMDVNYGSVLRKYLTESVDLIRIHRFDPADLQFGDALVSSAVVWFRNRTPRPGHIAELSYAGTLFAPLVSRRVPISDLRVSHKWSGLVHRAATLRTHSYTLSDLFRIKRGLATGDNKFFVLSEDKVNELGIPPSLVKPLLPSPRHLDSDIVESDLEGRPISTRRLYLLDCDLDEREISRLAPALASYLEGGREKAAATYICSRRTPWYSQEVRPPAPIVCTYMGRGFGSKARPFRFILNKSKATALNVYLMLYPTPLLARAMAQDPQLITNIWSLLNDVPADALLGEGRVYGGGLYKMEPNELANLPADRLMELLPKLGSEQMVQREMFCDLVA